MKFFFTVLLVITSFSDLDKIARVNQVKKEAKEAYLKGDYETALNRYRFLTDSLEVIDDDIRLNIANAYYNLQDSAQAINNYSELFDSKNKLVRSTAHQQMGVMSSRNKKFEDALDHFKEALKADPSNQDARYNYELMKKILKEQEEQEQEQQNQDRENQEENKDQEQQKQDQQNKDQEQKNEEQKKQEQEQEEENKEGEGEEQEKDEEKKSEEQKKEEEGEPKEEEKPEPKEGEEAEEKEDEEQKNSLSEKLEEMKISEEKAKMILEALKNKEIQYYQQNKRKPTKRKDPKKPDW